MSHDQIINELLGLQGFDVLDEGIEVCPSEAARSQAGPAATLLAHSTQDVSSDARVSHESGIPRD